MGNMGQEVGMLMGFWLSGGRPQNCLSCLLSQPPPLSSPKAVPIPWFCAWVHRSCLWLRDRSVVWGLDNDSDEGGGGRDAAGEGEGRQGCTGGWLSVPPPREGLL